MFSYIEKPFTVVDVTADDVVVVCDCDDKNDIIIQQYTTLFYHLLTHRTHFGDSLEVRNAYLYLAGNINWMRARSV
jgi:hypothetical protein